MEKHLFTIHGYHQQLLGQPQPHQKRQRLHQERKVKLTLIDMVKEFLENLNTSDEKLGKEENGTSQK